MYKELSVFTLSPPPDSSGSEEAPLPPIGLGFTWLVTIAATEVSGSSRGSRVPPLGRGRTGRHGAEPGRYPRQRDPRGGLHSHRPALPLARAGRWRKEVLALASGENSPARQGSPAPSALVPAEEPAKGCVSPPSLPTPPPPTPPSHPHPHTRPRTTHLWGSGSREKGLEPRRGRVGARRPCPRLRDRADATLGHRAPV